jgi:hypothetical protein
MSSLGFEAPPNRMVGPSLPSGLANLPPLSNVAASKEDMISGSDAKVTGPLDKPVISEV